MELQTIPESEVSHEPPFETTDQPVQSHERAFILANTIRSSKDELRLKHLVPVFIKDNEPCISQADFIEIMQDATSQVFTGETILRPSVRLSHPIKGRIPEAKDKPAKELLEHEKTLYYERMAFTIEVSSVCEDISGNSLKLMVGGIKAYNLDNLYQKSGADQHFKIFIGFQNTVCTNLCIWSDGYVGDLKVKDARQLQESIQKLFYQYDIHRQLSFMRGLDLYALTEHQFAQLIGRCRLYQYLSYQQKLDIPAIQLSDTQLSAVARDYYRDNSFCRDGEGQINLWRLYNLFTGASKSSYVDTFLDRNVSSSSFIRDIRDAIAGNGQSWFLS